jgi:hypothetical protein
MCYFALQKNLLDVKQKYFISMRIAVRAGVATGYGMDGRGVAVRIPVKSIFSSPRRPYRLCSPSSLLLKEFHQLSASRLELTESGVNNTSLNSIEVKKSWIYASTPPIHLHGALFNYSRAGINSPYFTD